MEQDNSEYIREKFKNPIPLVGRVRCESPHDEIVKKEFDMRDIVKKYYGNSRLNRLGGGICEPREHVSVERTTINENEVQKRIDLKFAADNEADLCHMLQNERQNLIRPMTGVTTKKPQVFHDKTNSDKIEWMKNHL